MKDYSRTSLEPMMYLLRLQIKNNYKTFRDKIRKLIEND